MASVTYGKGILASVIMSNETESIQADKKDFF